MASLSLPRVLQLKKNPLDAEREHFEKFQSMAISKAINSQEMPVKEKHVRSAIIGSFQEQGAVTYWVSAIRLPLQENRIVAWKFCHVTHKLLREGHPACLDDSQRHIATIENLGKLWVHLREGYGRLIHLYSALLAGKLRFHARNPQFPGTMVVTAEELDSIAENDVNNYFQLCVELFDYMDDILNLQAAVMESLGNARANSMTASGQCRLAALIPCAQDSSHIYDCNVRLLFRLHAALPPDVLAGHRERFRQQFKKLSAFYKHASTMQYYRNLLTLPQLPNNPPNFLLQSDFGTYVTPVVMIPEPEPEQDHETVASLVDTSDTMSQMTSQDSVDFAESFRSPSPQQDIIVQRDQLISELQRTLEKQRGELEERRGMLVSLRDHCAGLENKLVNTEKELDQERHRAELLSSQTPEITQKLNEVEEKAKLTDEKFQKLKTVYTQLRAEHISLIRQKAEVDKMSTGLKAAVAEHENVKKALQQQLDDRAKDMEQLQQSASASDAVNSEIEALRNEIITLKSDLEVSKEKELELEKLKISIEETQQLHKIKTTEAQEQISKVEEQKKELAETLESFKLEKSQLENEIGRLKEEIVVLKDSTSEEFRKAIEEKEAALRQIDEVKQLFEQEKKSLEGKLDHSEKERLTAECELQDLLQNNTSLEESLANVKNELQSALMLNQTYKQSLVQVTAKAGAELVSQAVEHCDSGALAHAALDNLTKHPVGEKEEETARNAILASHHTVQIANETSSLIATMTDNELIDSMSNETRAMLNVARECLEDLGRGDHEQCRVRAGDARGRARALAARVSGAATRTPARSVDDELADMDREIEDAANRIEEMLAASRAGDSGVKLEVNEKILDACTTLMAAVRALVRDARTLQSELGDPVARRTMYRRNPQWSEGLISAAKAVGVAAKLLVTSADEAVSGGGAVEGVSAASHEVAGATAQLVAASRARAPPASPALAALTHASRSVAAATGAVVAAARAAAALTRDHDDLEFSSLSLTATRRLEMESKVRALELEAALDAERARLAALRRRHYTLAQQEENGNITNGKH